MIKHSDIVAADYAINFEDAPITKPLPPDKKLMSG